MYKGYVRNAGRWLDPTGEKLCFDELDGFININIKRCQEIRICDEDDFVVMHFVDGELIFPIIWPSHNNAEQNDCINEN